MNAPPGRLQYLGWSAFAFHPGADAPAVAVDPFLAGSTDYGVPASPVARGELYPLEAVVVSHASDDHRGEAFEMAIESGATLCAGPDVRLSALAAGVPAGQTAPLVPGVVFVGDGWTVKALAAQHISLSRLKGAYMFGPPLCFLFDLAGTRVFHGGDTALTSDLELYGRVYAPHIALLGIGGVLFQGRRATELDPREAAIAAEMLGVRAVVPMHYTDAAEVDELRAAVPKGISVLELAPGGSVELGSIVKR